MPNKHGGNREGAGRPALANKKKPVTLRLDPVVADWLRAQYESQAVVVEKALRKLHRIG